MKVISILAVLAIAIFECNLQAQEISDYLTENRSAFTLQIEGFSEIEGEVRIAVFDSKKKYKKDPVHAIVLKVDDLSVEWTVDGLPFGEYAIAVYHDRNVNGELDTNLLGIPKEKYGFSNNARGRFGPASWGDAVFEVNKSRVVHTISIE